MATATEDKLHDLLQDFDSAILITCLSDGQLRPRLMVLTDVDEELGA